MLGVVGKLIINYKVGEEEYSESIILDKEATFFLKGCNNCKLVIDEVVYVIDTVYGVTVYFDDDEDNSIFVSGNDTFEFSIPGKDIVGNMKISMF